MTTPIAPDVDCEQTHAGLAVSDIRAAIDFYTKQLGFTLAFTDGDPPTFAGVNLGHVQMFLELGTPSPAGCSVYFVVGNADELYQFQRANGVTVVEPPGDRIERVDVPLLDDGVASPHTRGDLRYIQELKKKHGIDYDAHASYRFVERSKAP